MRKYLIWNKNLKLMEGFSNFISTEFNWMNIIYLFSLQELSSFHQSKKSSFQIWNRFVLYISNNEKTKLPK